MVEVFHCTFCQQQYDPVDLVFGMCTHTMCGACVQQWNSECYLCRGRMTQHRGVAALQARLRQQSLYRRMYTLLQRQDPARACELFNDAMGEVDHVDEPAPRPRVGGAGGAAARGARHGGESVDARLRALEACLAPIPFTGNPAPPMSPLMLNDLDEEETRSLEEVPLALRAAPLPPLPEPYPLRAARALARAPPSPPPSSPPRLQRQNAHVGPPPSSPPRQNAHVGGSSSSASRRRRHASSEEGARTRRRLLVLSSPSSHSQDA